MTAPDRPRYVIVTPVKDEERYVELTLRSVTTQTLRPGLWVIVDDGSTDSTPAILASYASQFPFIRVLNSRTAGARKLGSAEASAFKIGHASLGSETYDYIVKLDGDLSFEPDYFERLLTRFELNERLGIGSGVYLEIDSTGGWSAVSMPSYHAFGACKVVRRQCFEDIGGFLTSPGWDTVDEIRALNSGWTTGHFPDLEVKHHKREGSSMGALATSVFHGHIFYVTGGDLFFLLLKTARRITSRPYISGALALAFGYLRSALKGSPRLVTAVEAQCYRRMLRARLRGAPTPVLRIE